VALIFGILALQFPDAHGLTPASTNLSFVRDFDTFDIAVGGAIIGTIVFLVFLYLLIAAWSNAVNLTDGLDGLAAGTTAMVMGAYALISFWQFRNSCAVSPAAGCYEVRDPLDLAVLAAAGLGGCLGFLWWNAAPAKIFMGDTGSLALGGLVAGLSVTTRTELLMIIIGAIFVIETVSVVIQIIVFRSTGKRFFRMAPIHHHFENGGWAETAVVTRFWLLSAMAAIAGVCIFYGDWLSAVGFSS
ncbi:MAG: phospho-N-acetylmuramoyl-pentapeptide-transferase, partial [Corynebacterium sp.]|nr:phospho-N-acetylmuramoyl-pentapeptide-transferase [Corynebacterium sp.]